MTWLRHSLIYALLTCLLRMIFYIQPAFSYSALVSFSSLEIDLNVTDLDLTCLETQYLELNLQWLQRLRSTRMKCLGCQ